VSAVASTAAVEFDGVTVAYGRTIAVDRLSLVVAAGEKVAITGANGAGKSTLLRSLLGLQRIDAGVISVDGSVATTGREWADRRADVAYIPQRPAQGRFPLAVRELLASCGDLDAAIGPAEQLDIIGLLDRPVATLSGGQLQRCFIARGLGSVARGSRVLVADEPTSALDFDGQDQVAALLGAATSTVVVVTHEQTVVERCERVVAMASGRLRDAGPS
jgi:zinc transport system ATP-binding protein